MGFKSKNISGAFAGLACAAVIGAGTVLAQDASTGLFHDDASNLDYAAIGDMESPEKILVMIHGAGGDYREFKDFGQDLASRKDNLLVIVPNGPHSFAELLPPEQKELLRLAQPNADLSRMRNWIGNPDVSGVVTQDDLNRVMAASNNEIGSRINMLIDGQLDRYGLDDEDLVIYGFSAGSSVAVHAALGRDNACAGVIAHSGVFYGHTQPASTPDMLVMFGGLEVANPQIEPAYNAMIENLRALDVPVTEHIVPGLAHGINMEALETFLEFTANAFDKDAQAGVPAPQAPQP